MSFPTLDFAYFYLVVLTVAWAVRRHRRVRNGFLLAASFFFYGRWDPKLCLYLASLGVLDYAAGEALHTWRDPRARRFLAVLAVAANVGLLAWLKLYDFFRESAGQLAAWLGVQAHLPAIQVLVPVGLSFYAFQGIAYVVDCYRGRAVRAESLLDFLLFIAFFPKLLAGPLCRSDELLPQIARAAPERIPEPGRALLLIVIGLTQKMVLAAYLSTHMVAEAFELPERHSSMQLAVAAFAYTAEIYLDFSGYTDLARGLALLLGFQLPENFRQPYAAGNIGDFWRRWHMTFSRWLREYVYFPLGGSRGSQAKTARNLILTMLVCGLWHGAAWGFVIWGLLHGLALAAHRVWRGTRPLPFWFGWAITLCFCVLARVFFRAEDLETALTFLVRLFSFTGGAHGIDPGVVAITLFCFASQFVGPGVLVRLERTYARLPGAVRPLAWGAVGLLILNLQPDEIPPYIYFGF